MNQNQQPEQPTGAHYGEVPREQVEAFVDKYKEGMRKMLGKPVPPAPASLPRAAEPTTAQQMIDELRAIVYRAHDIIDTCPHMTPRHISHGGLTDRIEKLVSVAAWERSEKEKLEREKLGLLQGLDALSARAERAESELAAAKEAFRGNVKHTAILCAQWDNKRTAEKTAHAATKKALADANAAIKIITEGHPNASLVCELRDRSQTAEQRALAFGVSEVTSGKVINGKGWTHVSR